MDIDRGQINLNSGKEKEKEISTWEQVYSTVLSFKQDLTAVEASSKSPQLENTSSQHRMGIGKKSSHQARNATVATCGSKPDRKSPGNS